MSRRTNSPNLNGVHVTESSKKGYLAKALGKKIYKLATSVTLPSSKGFVASQPRSYIQQAKIFFSHKKLKVKITGVWSSVEWAEE